MLILNFVLASICFAIWVSEDYKDPWAAGFFMSNLLFGFMNLAMNFK